MIKRTYQFYCEVNKGDGSGSCSWKQGDYTCKSWFAPSARTVADAISKDLQRWANDYAGDDAAIAIKHLSRIS